MTKKLHYTYMPAPQAFANNRGQGFGNHSNLQTLTVGEDHRTTVSANAKRAAFREYMVTQLGWNAYRSITHGYDKEALVGLSSATTEQEREDIQRKFPDLDLFGYFSTEKAETKKSNKKGKGASKEDKESKEDKKGSSQSRRSPWQVSRAVSLTPSPGDTFTHVRSGVSKGDRVEHGAPYTHDAHHTSYAFSGTLNVGDLINPDLVEDFIQAMFSVSQYGGSHTTNLCDYSPTVALFRIADEPAHRMMDVVRMVEVSPGDFKFDLSRLIETLEEGDIPPNELIVGYSNKYVNAEDLAKLDSLGVQTVRGMNNAKEEILCRMRDM